MTPIEKIREALTFGRELLPGYSANRAEFDEALAALAELEKSTAPVAEIREVVVTDEMCRRVATALHRVTLCANASDMRDVLQLWQKELGPSLGLVELKEPTPGECERICMCYLGLDSPPSFGAKLGREVFDAVKDVMWPKSEGL